MDDPWNLPATAGSNGGVPPVRVGGLMIALGDSIAAGIGASHASEGCMALLAQRLRRHRADLHLLNLAIPGESSESMVGAGGQLERAEEALAQAAAEGVAVGPITLSIGGNDMMEAALVGDAEAMQRLHRNLDVIVDRLGARLAAVGRRLADVMCIQTVYNPFEATVAAGAPSPDDMAPRRARRGGSNHLIRDTAQRAGIRIADVAAVFRGRADELTWVRSGDIHPNGEGHRAIAHAYTAALGRDR